MNIQCTDNFSKSAVQTVNYKSFLKCLPSSGLFGKCQRWKTDLLSVININCSAHQKQLWCRRQFCLSFSLMFCLKGFRIKCGSNSHCFYLHCFFSAPFNFWFVVFHCTAKRSIQLNFENVEKNSVEALGTASEWSLKQCQSIIRNNTSSLISPGAFLTSAVVQHWPLIDGKFDAFVLLFKFHDDFHVFTNRKVDSRSWRCLSPVLFIRVRACSHALGRNCWADAVQSIFCAQYLELQQCSSTGRQHQRNLLNC